MNNNEHKFTTRNQISWIQDKDTSNSNFTKSFIRCRVSKFSFENLIGKVVRKKNHYPILNSEKNNEQLYKNWKKVDHTLKKRRLSFYRYLFGMENNRLRTQIFSNIEKNKKENKILLGFKKSRRIVNFKKSLTNKC